MAYGASRRDILNLFGSSSRVLSDHQERCHIIMERTSGKTMDAFIEFCTPADAVEAVRRSNKSSNRKFAINGRDAILSTATHEDLQESVFPMARGIKWNGATPCKILDTMTTKAGHRFFGFVAKEEMDLLEKHCIYSERVNNFLSLPQLYSSSCLFFYFLSPRESYNCFVNLDVRVLTVVLCHL